MESPPPSHLFSALGSEFTQGRLRCLSADNALNYILFCNTLLPYGPIDFESWIFSKKWIFSSWKMRQREFMQFILTLLARLLIRFGITTLHFLCSVCCYIQSWPSWGVFNGTVYSKFKDPPLYLNWFLIYKNGDRFGCQGQNSLVFHLIFRPFNFLRFFCLLFYTHWSKIGTGQQTDSKFIHAEVIIEKRQFRPSTPK